MTRALCTRCGAIKFGAFCDCYHCGGPADPDQSLSIALSDHQLSVGALERIGAVVRDIAALTPDGDLRRAALLAMFRDRFPASYHRDIATSLLEPARALLATVSLPTVNTTRCNNRDHELATLCGTPPDPPIDAVRSEVAELVAAEPPDAPYSDARLVELLAAPGVRVTRRIVARVREHLGIASSSRRKR